MRRATFLANARDDLRSIFRYIADSGGSVNRAKSFVRKLSHKCDQLAALEVTMGRSRPDLIESVRSFPYKGYVIFFRYNEDRFEVVNILEGHRDFEAHFREKGTPEQ